MGFPGPQAPMRPVGVSCQWMDSGGHPRAPLGSQLRPVEAPSLLFGQTLPLQRPRSPKERKGRSVGHQRKRFGMGLLCRQTLGTSLWFFLCLIH